MKEKHTPGPWFVVPNKSFIEITTSQEKYAGKTICDVCSSGYAFDNGDCLNGETTVANAKLIAAAPELLSACAFVRDQLDYAEAESEGAAGFNLLLDRLNSAIGKALN
ncbi:hypothetical protein FNI11_13725 [Salmonella enterica subsp. salamae]|nr:hypothetical protein [Salmonella enterica subsp. salamae]ECJ2281412.1 hypothetical protein [Salmonella enterica subsp. salamae]